MADVVFSGPLFDGRGEQLLDHMCQDIQATVADEAFVKFESNLEEHIRHSGPRYQRYIQVVERDGDTVVNDGWDDTNTLPYGPWLEGVGSRNAPVTRFEGYHSLENSFEDTTAEVDQLAEPVVDEYVDRINHE